jgi:hypothetical protein
MSSTDLAVLPGILLTVAIATDAAVHRQGGLGAIAPVAENGQPRPYASIRCFSTAAARIDFCSFSNARTSIWRTRSRLTP